MAEDKSAYPDACEAGLATTPELNGFILELSEPFSLNS